MLTYTFDMSKSNPDWLPQVRDFCRGAGIKIMGWGPDLVTVEAKSPERAKEIALQFASLGFKPIQNEDDAYAGMLDLSRNPDAVQAIRTQKAASVDIARRPRIEQISPLIWPVLWLLLIVLPDTRGHANHPSWFRFFIVAVTVIFFLAEATRIWGWRLALLPDGLRIRRRFRWITIPWEKIRSVESVPTGRFQERVSLSLGHSSERLGTFGFIFARSLRDRLHAEIAQRRAQS